MPKSDMPVIIHIRVYIDIYYNIMNDHIYIYILPVKSIWIPSNIFIFHPKNVIFNETSLAPQ